jgi:hypothetical protein
MLINNINECLRRGKDYLLLRLAQTTRHRILDCKWEDFQMTSDTWDYQNQHTKCKKHHDEL